MCRKYQCGMMSHQTNFSVDLQQGRRASVFKVWTVGRSLLERGWTQHLWPLSPPSPTWCLCTVTAVHGGSGTPPCYWFCGLNVQVVECFWIGSVLVTENVGYVASSGGGLSGLRPSVKRLGRESAPPRLRPWSTARKGQGDAYIYTSLDCRLS